MPRPASSPPPPSGQVAPDLSAGGDAVSYLTVIRFPGVEAAVACERSLARHLTEHDCAVLDAAILLWDSPKSAPRTRHLTNVALRSAAGSTLWSLIQALTVDLRLLGEDAPMSVLEPVGVPGELLRELRDSLRPGTAAIFLLTGSLLDSLNLDVPATAVHRATLTALQHAKLQQVFCP